MQPAEIANGDDSSDEAPTVESNVDDDGIRVLSEEVPQEDPSEHAADALIAQQLTDLSKKEREKVLYDVHGIPYPIDESPEMITESLKELEEELEKLPDKEAYNIAKSMNPDYVSNRDFRIRFLRADLFNTKDAALRIARHFECKVELFGREKLCKDIVQDDLNEDDIEALYSGFFQILPFRDPKGRLISLTYPHAKNRAFSCISKVSEMVHDISPSQTPPCLTLFLLATKGLLFINGSYGRRRKSKEWLCECRICGWSGRSKRASR